MNKQIPKIAYIETQILCNPDTRGILAPAVRAVEKKYGLEDGSLGDGIFLQTRIITLLYSLILFPKEFWSLGKDNDIYRKINDVWSTDSVSIITDKSHWEDPIYKFIHHLRNSIAHVNFSFRDNEFEFWDQNKKNVEKYRAILSTASIQKFLEVVGSMFANFEKQNKA